MTDLHEQADKLSGNPIALELVEEQAVVSRRLVAGATVRVATTTSVRDEQIDLSLTRETVEVQRVAIGRIVDVPPELRQEGDVTIVPVMEEVVVVERRLVLKEEVWIKRVRTTEVHRETVQLRQQAAAVTRSDADAPDASAKKPDLHITIS